jgi:ABC-2 type transport system ATP-binding protein
MGFTSLAMVITTKSLSKCFGAVPAVSGLSLQIAEGEIFGFLGPNGAGKTTTIRLLLGFLRPSGGTATVLGRDAWREAAQAHEQIGYLPGDVRLYDFMTGADFLALMARLRGLRGIAAGRQLAERLGLDLAPRIKTYSRGTRQKLGLVQALMHVPRLILLDEPTASLDPLVQEDVYEILREQRAAGASVFFSSHVLSEVEKVCDRVAIIRGGQLAALETVEGLRERAARRVRVTLAAPPPGRFELAGATPLSADGATFTFAVRGDVNPVIRQLAGLQLADVAIEPPRLEDLFLDYYHAP